MQLPPQVGACRVAVAADARRRLADAGAAWAALLPEEPCLHEFHQDQVRAVEVYCCCRLKKLLHMGAVHTAPERAHGGILPCPCACTRLPLPLQVLEVPPGAALLASSERCPVEMFTVGSPPHVLCIQGAGSHGGAEQRSGAAGAAQPCAVAGPGQGPFHAASLSSTFLRFASTPLAGHPEFDAEVVAQLAEPRLGSIIGEADAQVRLAPCPAGLPLVVHACSMRGHSGPPPPAPPALLLFACSACASPWPRCRWRSSGRPCRPSAAPS